MKTSSCEQRTADWFQCRVGRVTASRIETLCGRLKNGQPTKAAEDLILEILCEQVTGQQTEHFTTKEMQWGIDTEPLARVCYEHVTGVEVGEIGFVYHPTILWAGCSPDGLVGEDGLIEIKCPSTSTFLRHRLATYDPLSFIPYYSQVQFQLACTGRSWCDLAFFDPRVPAHLELHITRIPRDERHILHLNHVAMEVLAKVEEMKGRLDVGGLDAA